MSDKQVFVRSVDLGLQNPPIIGLYPIETPVAATVHGDGMSIYYLSDQAILFPAPESGFGLRLVDNWQSYTVTPAVAAAAQRAETGFSMPEQIENLRQSIELLHKHGTDLSIWSPEAKRAKAELDTRWSLKK